LIQAADLVGKTARIKEFKLTTSESDYGEPRAYSPNRNPRPGAPLAFPLQATVKRQAASSSERSLFEVRRWVMRSEDCRRRQGGTGKQVALMVKSLSSAVTRFESSRASTDSRRRGSSQTRAFTRVRASLEDTARAHEGVEGASLPLRMTPAIRRRHASREGQASPRVRGKAAGVHLVFNSVGSANRQNGVPLRQQRTKSKTHRQIGVTSQRSAPVFFHGELYSARRSSAKASTPRAQPRRGQLGKSLSPDYRCAVRLLEDQAVRRKRFDLGGDELTGQRRQLPSSSV